MAPPIFHWSQCCPIETASGGAQQMRVAQPFWQQHSGKNNNPVLWASDKIQIY